MVYNLISVIILLFLGGTPERRNLLVYDLVFMSSKMHLLTSYLRRYMHLRIHTHYILSLIAPLPSLQ